MTPHESKVSGGKEGNLESGIWGAGDTGLAGFSSHLYQYIPTFGYSGQLMVCFVAPLWATCQ